MNAPLAPITARYTYHVVSSAACMPNSCWGVYRRVAVLEVDHHERPGHTPTRIADVRGVRVVATWERLNVGTTDACAYRVALRDAEACAERLRSERVQWALQAA